MNRSKPLGPVARQHRVPAESLRDRRLVVSTPATLVNWFVVQWFLPSLRAATGTLPVGRKIHCFALTRTSLMISIFVFLSIACPPATQVPSPLDAEGYLRRGKRSKRRLLVFECVGRTRAFRYETRGHGLDSRRWFYAGFNERSKQMTGLWGGHWVQRLYSRRAIDG